MDPDRTQLEASQLAQLRTLVGALLEGNPFYSRILREARIDENLPSLDEFFERVPFLRKQDLTEDQRAHPPYGSNLTYPVERYTRLSQTSGTSGRPLYWLDTTDSWEWMLDTWERVYQSAGITSADRMFFAF